MNIGPLDSRGANQIGTSATQEIDDSTGNLAVDEAIAAFQAAITQFTIHGNPATITEVAKGALEIDSTLRTSNLSPEQKEAVLSNLKTSILDSGLPNLGNPAIASEADNLFSHLLPSILLDFPSISALFDESNTESPLLAAVGSVDTAQAALESAKQALVTDPSNKALKEQVQGLVEQYLNELLNLRSTLNEYAPAVGNEDVSGLKAALDEIAGLADS